MSVIDMTGKKCNRLTVVERANNRPDGTAVWSCVCDCGNTTTVTGSSLRRGDIKSCGCIHRERQNAVDNRYGVWRSMKRRCLQVNHHKYPLYGGRGITVCDRWMEFKNFIEDMGVRPDGTTIDRKDGNGNYCPENCIWATATEQNRNRSNNRHLTLYGVTKTISEWCEIADVNLNTVISRLNHGWDDRRAVFTPAQKRSSVR